MLKGIPPILSPDLLHALRAMGHGDTISIVDGNYPADNAGRRVVRADAAGSVDILDAILAVMPLDDFVPVNAMIPEVKGDPAHDEPIFHEFRAVLARREGARVRLVKLPPAEFYPAANAAYVMVATGERRLYGNIILKKGVIRPDE
jgi:L-fucose mutarotase